MNELFSLINELRKRIQKYKNLLSANEALARYVLIDPVLRALGWDTENPDIVRPEERQSEGRPDYVLYHEGKKLIALEAKSLNSRLDEKRVLDLGFKYSWREGIRYFVITDGNIWRVYDVYEPDPEKRLILEVNISAEPLEEVVRKMLSLWKPLVKNEIKPIKPILQLSEKISKSETETNKYTKKELDLERVRKFYESLTDKGKAFIEIIFKAWKEGRTLTKDDIIAELRKRGINVDRRGFTGIKSGITRLSRKMNLPPPMPTEEDLGEEYWKNETKRYRLKDEWGEALERIFGSDVVFRK